MIKARVDFLSGEVKWVKLDVAPATLVFPIQLSGGELGWIPPNEEGPDCIPRFDTIEVQKVWDYKDRACYREMVISSAQTIFGPTK